MILIQEDREMYRTKLCLGIEVANGLSYEERIALFKKIGFDAFFVDWKKELDFEGIKAAADKEGMIVQSVHAPFHKMASMWEKDDTTETAIQELLDSVDSCITLGTDIMIVHAIIGFDKHTPNDFGVQNYKKVVDYAKEKGVRIAFENTEGEEYLACLMDVFKDYENVGFCWDTGHEMCYNHSKDMTALYGDRLIAMHLNDNLGIWDYEGKIKGWDDLHLLPFDGIADWKDIVDRLNRCGFDGILTFEMSRVSKPGRHENDAYARMDLEEYLTNVYMRACRVAQLKLNRK